MNKLSLILLLTASSIAQSATYYIDFSGGTDAKNGLTPTSAWKSLEMWNSALPGDTVLFKRGEVWVGGMYIRKSNITFAAYGIGALPIIRQSDSGQVPIYIDSQSHLTFRNLHITANYAVAIYFGTWMSGADGEGCSYILIDSCSIAGPTEIFGAYNTIQYCTIDGTTNNGPLNYSSRSGIFAHHTPSHNNVFKGNTIHRFDRSGIHTLQHTHDDQILGNTVYNIKGPTPNQDGQAIDLDSYGDVSWHNVVTGNTVHDAEWGIGLENCFDTIVESNIVFNIAALNSPGGNGIGSILYSTGKLGGDNNQYGANGDIRGMNTLNIIRGNTVHDVLGAGIAVFDAGAITIDANVLHNNTGGDIYVTSSVK